MEITFNFIPYILNFKFEAGTSRGVMTQRKIWIIKLVSKSNPNQIGIGEAAPINGLSIDNIYELEKQLIIWRNDNNLTLTKLEEFLREKLFQNLPSLKFALETALMGLHNNNPYHIFSNKFILGKHKIKTNGLVWMGKKEDMLNQVAEKITQGFKCIKIKVGAIDFNHELEVLQHIRNNFTKEEIIIRIDANGAWDEDEALKKLSILEPLNIHSIEQPIKEHQYKSMQKICKESPIKIALDEELIGIYDEEEMNFLLEEIKPAYIILKPSLLGGFKSTSQWIRIAESKSIRWWITSALESNIGLNAICQFTSEYPDIDIAQGLGTGQLFHNNISSPLTLKKGFIYNDIQQGWQKIPI
ncbi:MAG: o-succinylbenzoate synthase [Cytophagales bacterium]|nr:MAG: o-succinylbenzoate synthase [Cytophagales bacterium]